VNQAIDRGGLVASRRPYTSWIFLGAAILAGALAFWLSRLYLARQEEIIRHDVAGSQRNLVEVVVASKSLNAGDVVGSGSMAIGRLPAAYVSTRFVTPAHFDEMKGRVLLRAKAAGEPLMADDVAGVAVERFSDLLKPGERAVTLEVSELTSNAGLLLPGDYIDLYLMRHPEGGDGGGARSLTPVLQDVRVLAAGPEALHAQDQQFQTLDQSNAHYSTITVAVNVQDAEKLVLARKAGDMAFLLRNSRDTGNDGATALSLAQLIGGPTHTGNSAGSYQYFSAQVPEGVMRHQNVELGDSDGASSSDSNGLSGAAAIDVPLGGEVNRPAAQ
jgi:pilus assembly protein CpaB